MHANILRRCGFVLIIVGAIDIAYMVWCIANQVTYNSSFNIFALVGGILLVRGGLKTARWVATLSTFMLAACGVTLVVMPFLYPAGYWMAVLRHGSGLVISFVIAASLIALLIWVRQQVLHPAVLQALLAAGLPAPRTKVAAGVGLALPVLLVILLRLILQGDTAHEAIRRAELQLGRKYHYVVTSMQMSSNMKGKSVFAIVTAYNDAELKSIQVSWKE